MNDDLIQKFGFSEMYEWDNIPEPQYRLGRFVAFSDKQIIDQNGTIVAANRIVPVSKSTQTVIGVTTVNSVIDSDNPNEWKYKNICNEYGDMYLRKEKLSVGQKVYDQYNEMNYIRTSPWEHFIPIPNAAYDSSKQYIKRTNRSEWVRVNLLGKAVVEDDGTCIPGQYCMPYTGKLKPKQGTAVPATDKAKQKFYVLERLSEKSIIILNK